MMILPDDFKELLKLLNENKVHYLIVGGYAVAYYGYVRATNDLDIWIATDKENIRKVKSSLLDFGFDEDSLPDSVFKKKDTIIRMGIPPFRIELLMSVSGINFNETYPAKHIVKIDDLEIPFIDIDNLKKNKKASARHKDLDDLEHI